MVQGVLLSLAYNFCEFGLYFFFATEEKEDHREKREKAEVGVVGV